MNRKRVHIIQHRVCTSFQKPPWARKDVNSGYWLTHSSFLTHVIAEDISISGQLMLRMGSYYVKMYAVFETALVDLVSGWHTCPPLPHWFMTLVIGYLDKSDGSVYSSYGRWTRICFGNVWYKMFRINYFVILYWWNMIRIKWMKKVLYEILKKYFSSIDRRVS